MGAQHSPSAEHLCGKVAFSMLALHTAQLNRRKEGTGVMGGGLGGKKIISKARIQHLKHNSVIANIVLVGSPDCRSPSAYFILLERD